jgi:hypothetical protein
VEQKLQSFLIATLAFLLSKEKMMLSPHSISHPVILSMEKSASPSIHLRAKRNTEYGIHFVQKLPQPSMVVLTIFISNLAPRSFIWVLLTEQLSPMFLM